MNKRQELGIQSKQKILDAAERLLANRGYAGMSTTQLSKDSGLPVASIYWHFGNKAGVVAEVVNRHSDSVFKSLAYETREGQDSFDALDDLIRRSTDAIGTHTDFFRLVAFLSMDTSEDSAATAAAVQGIHDRAVATWNEGLVQVFQPRTAAERAKVLDLAELGRTMYLGGVVLWATHGQGPLTRAIRAYEEMLRATLSLQSMKTGTGTD